MFPITQDWETSFATNQNITKLSPASPQLDRVSLILFVQLCMDCLTGCATGSMGCLTSSLVYTTGSMG